MKDFWTEVLQFAQETTAKIAAGLAKDFGKIEAKCKADGSLVTEADRWADQTIREAIASRFPDHGVLTEETKHILPERDWCWIVDPLDGTTNFTRGIPLWGISLGLLYQGTPVFGLVRIPQVNQCFHGFWYGESGLSGPTGAYLNQKPIRTCTNTPSGSHLFNLCARSTAVIKKSTIPCKIRMLGVASYSILLVASGTAIGAVEATPKIWDIAAAWVILQAAGGIYVALEPEPVFPLQAGQNYGSRPFPCLVLSEETLVTKFKPLVEFLGEKALASG